MPLTNTEQFENLSRLIKDSVEELKVETKAVKDELLGKINDVAASVDDINRRFEGQDRRITAAENNIIEIKAKYENVIENLHSTIKKLSERLEKVEAKQTAAESIPKDLNDVKELVEERTNRQLRETLIFKNVPERGGGETYNKTREVLAELISTHCSDIGYDEAYQIKRCHREKQRENDDGPLRAGKRHIYCAFVNWYFSQQVLDAFKRKCIDDRNFVFAVDQKYGPLTTKRRGLALKERKRLKDEGTIDSGFIVYPAKLFVALPGDLRNDGRKAYNLHADFSKHVVN